MEATIKSTSGPLRRTAAQHPAPPSAETERIRAVYDDLVLMGMPRVNMLFVGDDGTVGRLLETLGNHFKQPVASWSPGTALVLPPVERTGTFFIRDVGALALDDQIHLLEWLAAASGRTQVVSTTTTPLLPRVRAGAFVDTLYYRLNTVYVDVTA